MPLTRKSGKRSSSRRATRKVGLKPIEREQVKTIASKLDAKQKQSRQALSVTPGAHATGATYANYAFPSIPAASTNLMKLLPRIPQGLERENRTGSKIKLMGVVTDFFFHIPPATLHNNAYVSVACRLLVMSPKIIQKVSTFSDNWTAGEALESKYLRDGSQETNFKGDLNSLRFPVNTALFTTHHDKRFTLNRGLLVGDPAEGMGNVPDAQKHIRLSLKVKSKSLRFSDAGVVEPDNYAPFAILLYAPCNGQIATANVVAGNAFVDTTWHNL